MKEECLSRDNLVLKVVDLLCEREEAIYAPFDGKLSYHQVGRRLYFQIS